MMDILLNSQPSTSSAEFPEDAAPSNRTLTIDDPIKIHTKDMIQINSIDIKEDIRSQPFLSKSGWIKLNGFIIIAIIGKGFWRMNLNSSL